MTEQEIKQLIVEEVSRQLSGVEAIQNDTDEVLECIMFSHPKEWGRRIVRRNNEVVLQSTENGGLSWIDESIGDFKMVLPEMSRRSASSNPYVGLSFIPITYTKSASTEMEDSKIGDEIQSCIDSGRLLNKRMCSIAEKEHILSQNQIAPELRQPYQNTRLARSVSNEADIEVITFLNGASTFGVAKNQLYLDSNRFLKLG